MSIFDTILLVFLAGFVFYGFFFGLVRTIGSIAGVVAGFVVASRYYLMAYAWAGNLFFGYEKAGKVVCFVLLFTLANRLVGFAFALLDSALGVISIIPFVKTINRLSGAALGFIEGVITLGLVFYYIQRFGILSGFVEKLSVGSKILPFSIDFLNSLLPFLPVLLDKAKNFA